MSTARRERAAELCRQLTADVAKVAPVGLGTWGAAWEIVAAPSDRFLDLLNAWEATGAPELRPEIREAYDATVAAWTEAASRYAGRKREPVAA
jgi:hypothetical protein